MNWIERIALLAAVIACLVNAGSVLVQGYIIRQQMHIVDQQLKTINLLMMMRNGSVQTPVDGTEPGPLRRWPQ